MKFLSEPLATSFGNEMNPTYTYLGLLDGNLHVQDCIVHPQLKMKRDFIFLVNY